MNFNQKYLIIKNKNETIFISKQDNKKVYLFNGMSKIIVDNVDKTIDEIVLILNNIYKINHEKLKKDVDFFLNQLKELSNSENKTLDVSLEDYNRLLNNKIINHVTIEITNICPFKCKHCYVDKKTNNNMSFEVFKKIIDEMLEIKCYGLTITGGEPLVHSEFKKMYKYAKEKGIIIDINSNGYLINDEIISLFNQYKPNSIEISIYGYNNQSYYDFTGIKKSFDVVNKNIKKILSHNIDVKLKTTITKSNFKYLNKIQAYAKKLNLDFRYDYLVFPKLSLGTPARNPEFLKPDEIIEVFKADKETVKYFKKAVLETYKMKCENNNIDKIFQCSIGKEQVFIDCYGNIKPCLVLNEKYNINDFKIEETLKKIRHGICNLKISENSKCKTCYKRKLCRYCPGRFYLETGKYDMPPKEYCELCDKLMEEFKPKFSYLYFTPDRRINKKYYESIYEILINNENKINGVDIASKEKYDKWVETILIAPNYYIIICKINDEVVGFIAYTYIEMGLMISEIQIKEEYQGKFDILRKLLNEFIKKVDKKYDKALATINSKNIKSQKAFTHIGFVNKKGILYEIPLEKLCDWVNKK